LSPRRLLRGADSQSATPGLVPALVSHNPSRSPRTRRQPSPLAAAPLLCGAGWQPAGRLWGALSAGPSRALARPSAVEPDPWLNPISTTSRVRKSRYGPHECARHTSRRTAPLGVPPSPDAAYLCPQRKPCMTRRADAVVRSRPPGRLLGIGNLIRGNKCGTRASRADQGRCEIIGQTIFAIQCFERVGLCKTGRKSIISQHPGVRPISVNLITCFRTNWSGSLDERLFSTGIGFAPAQPCFRWRVIRPEPIGVVYWSIPRTCRCRWRIAENVPSVPEPPVPEPPRLQCSTSKPVSESVAGSGSTT
jgi:hypothetical protein